MDSGPASWPEVLRVLFLGVCLDFYYFLWRVLFPKFGFNLGRGSVSQALVESCFVPPRHLLEGRYFYIDDIVPLASMDELVLVGAVNVFS